MPIAASDYWSIAANDYLAIAANDYLPMIIGTLVLMIDQIGADDYLAIAADDSAEHSGQNKAKNMFFFETFLQLCYCDLLMYYNGIGNV